MHIAYTPTFVRQYNKLPIALQEEVRDTIAAFQENPKARSLHTHKLKGRLKGYYSVRVNYKYRIIFEYDAPQTAALLQVGDHAVYD